MTPGDPEIFTGDETPVDAGAITDTTVGDLGPLEVATRLST